MIVLTTAFHFLISKRGALPAAAAFFFGASSAAGAASAITTSSALFSDIVNNNLRWCLRVLDDEQRRYLITKSRNDLCRCLLLFSFPFLLLCFACKNGGRGLPK